MQSLVYDAIKTVSNNQLKIEDKLVVEAALQININGKAYTTVMRTPGNDSELIRGLLYAEDIYKGEHLSLETLEKFENGFSVINAQIPKEKLGKGYLNKRTLLSVSSCGVCGKQKLEDVIVSGDSITIKNHLKLSFIKGLFQQMKLQQALFQSTGGSHATAAFDKNGFLLSIMEDIGRHNALDKVVGELLNKNKLKEIACILVSGRVSYEIVSKAFIAKIPMIVAVSACSSLAVDFAKEFGICLIGFSRDDKSTIYANPQHLEL
ncbi:formate dehydrogenase accessory sulfurtransferase FdhD [Aureibaculum sp. 2210JD6-5]|uniref:formate dehydrogenase accessory sulfurtransferase FdhD n=1 Tax=Aureibaculum sp. 2210JD6-5 TaxID=3103957 RepID=UPI002AAE6C87|nr:formate dehydrogenase accessory sulfurtransferase FdhD [Aureibaculum sp. 2210JD6-5]MDY7396612.1 formate dehydrogenase accessory sulfurtransferase FdhD [Aureibaculum sp. 2210JD6-5]